jgi:serine/threonine protein kinase
VNREQELVDEDSDSQDLVEKLATVLDTSDEFKTRIAARIQALQERLDESGDSSRALSEEQMMGLLKEFQDWALDRNDLEFQRKIDSGGFGDVFLGYQRSSSRIVAIKKIHSTDFSRYSFELLCREIRIATRLQHFAVLPFVGVCLSVPFCIVTEFMSGGSLYKRLRKDTNPLTATKLTIVALGVAAGLEYIHSQGYLHRDIKSLNILLDADDFPKICDFGLSRGASPDESPLTPQVGTAQWTAPEVLDSKPYGEKADVYSYGIFLWELLTKDLPFRGLRDYQVIVAVLQNNARPSIPPTCPPKLAKFLKVCWDRDPACRPTFEMIRKGFETGELDFPGADHDEVLRYINQFSQGLERKFDVGAASMEGVSMIIDELSGEVQEAVGRIQAIIYDDKWVSLILSSNLLPAFRQAIIDCSSARLAFQMSDVVHEMLRIPKLGGLLRTHEWAQAYLRLFSSFGTTAMPHAIDNLVALGGVTLSSEHIIKLSAFLVATDLTVRGTSTDFLCGIVENRRYEAEVMFSHIARNALVNAIPEALEGLLRSTLRLLMGLTGIAPALSQLCIGDSPERVFMASKHRNQAIASAALDLFIRIVPAGGIPSERTIALFVSEFPSLFKNWNDGNREKALRSFALLLKSEKVFAELSKSKDMLGILCSCFLSQSPKIALFSLKLFCAILANSSCFTLYSSLLPSLSVLLTSPFPSIRLLVASALTFGFAPNLATPELLEFLNRSFTDEKIVVAALKLAGVISGSFRGALFLEPVIPDALKLLRSPDVKVRHFAVLVCCSCALSNPISDTVAQAAPDMFALVHARQEGLFPLMFLSNLAVHPQGAVLCAKNFQMLVAELQSAKDTRLDLLLAAFERIVGVHESLNMLTVEDVAAFLAEARKYWTEEVAPRVFAVVDALVASGVGKKAIAHSDLPTIIQEKLRELPLTSPIRTSAMRILARAKAR